MRLYISRRICTHSELILLGIAWSGWTSLRLVPKNSTSHSLRRNVLFIAKNLYLKCYPPLKFFNIRWLHAHNSKRNNSVSTYAIDFSKNYSFFNLTEFSMTYSNIKTKQVFQTVFFRKLSVPIYNNFSHLLVTVFQTKSNQIKSIDWSFNCTTNQIFFVVYTITLRTPFPSNESKSMWWGDTLKSKNKLFYESTSHRIYHPPISICSSTCITNVYVVFQLNVMTHTCANMCVYNINTACRCKAYILCTMHYWKSYLHWKQQSEKSCFYWEIL